MKYQVYPMVSTSGATAIAHSTSLFLAAVSLLADDACSTVVSLVHSLYAIHLTSISLVSIA